MNNTMLRSMFCAVALFCSDALLAQSETVPLWQGTAPGSETWQLPETVTTGANGDRVISNVSVPTLSVFLPEPAAANGTAIVIAPGGALRVLGFDNEGTRVARWLNERGIAAFVLKYRTLQVEPQVRSATPAAGFAAPGRQELEIHNANANPAPDDAALNTVLRLAIADAQAALALVRQRAGEWNINADRVGLMGFSAGGGVAVGTTMAADGASYPDFLVSLYGPSLMDVNLPAHAPPLFIAVGNSHFNVTNGCLALFAAWKAAGVAAELHVYDQVSAGFGMTPRGLPVDDWPQQLLEWLQARELVPQ